MDSRHAVGRRKRHKQRKSIMNGTHTPAGFHPIRGDRLLQEQTHDAYKLQGKLPEPTARTGPLPC